MLIVNKGIKNQRLNGFNITLNKWIIWREERKGHYDK